MISFIFFQIVWKMAGEDTHRHQEAKEWPRYHSGLSQEAEVEALLQDEAVVPGLCPVTRIDTWVNKTT